MAIDMTQIYHSHRLEHRLSAEDCAGMFRVAKMVRTVEESRELDRLRFPSVIVSASGMATGGRVLHHLKTLAPDRRNTIVFAGFQAGGTRGARLLAGERTTRVFGEEIPVNAEVVALPALSAHADAAEILDWLRTAPKAPIATYLNHGEPGPADALRQRIEHELKWSVMVPLLGQRVELT
jgi:metallo-beta-lactamase family protein